MRKLRLVVSRGAGRLPVLLLAAVAPVAVAQCGSSTEIREPGPGGGSGGTAGTAGTGGQGLWPTGGGGASSDAGPDGGPICPGGQECTFEVQIPPEGVPADPAVLCAMANSPLESNRAARVTLTKYSDALNLANGYVEVEPTVLATVVGTPTVSVVDATDPALLGMQVTNVQPVAGGFSFHAQWPQPFDPPEAESPCMTVMTTFELGCGSDPSKTVQALTSICLCQDYGGRQWASSGDDCTTCVVCEMAPSPIVPAPRTDGLPLGRALRLGVVELARVGRTRVLLAEHDGGPGLDYEWHVTAGSIERLAADVLLWTLPTEGTSELAQVALRGPGVAAVASLAA